MGADVWQAQAFEGDSVTKQAFLLAQRNSSSHKLAQVMCLGCCRTVSAILQQRLEVLCCLCTIPSCQGLVPQNVMQVLLDGVPVLAGIRAHYLPVCKYAQLVEACSKVAQACKHHPEGKAASAGGLQVELAEGRLLQHHCCTAILFPKMCLEESVAA
eukprot:CAMPEP_0202364832 /NCGR_PEP_ID=MMETSP1126-20121109/16086_1 /ASSEMBLY_ACC=CAM_ASM_000457 /TAXON_ID=3047 /ORGANISM="Dunaliella tertiolecta, Strain CCMP1320" /LENGTH=156 /DNA_ID=CAMNT_0048959561 /DNA_START=309 /DNA_END=779 /DNA_ORIENTATION=-